MREPTVWENDGDTVVRYDGNLIVVDKATTKITISDTRVQRWGMWAALFLAGVLAGVILGRMI